MLQKTFEEHFPNQKVPEEAQWCNCNHCVNNYGIDLCGCGSGEPVGECDGDFEACKSGSPSQSLFEKMFYTG